MNELLDEIEMEIKFEPGPDTILGECPVCGEAIRSRDDRYEIDGNVICEDCVSDYVYKYFVLGDAD